MAQYSEIEAKRIAVAKVMCMVRIKPIISKEKIVIISTPLGESEFYTQYLKSII